MSRKRLAPLSAELMVVVVGVLIALAADSWWEGRQDHARVGTYLVAIQADLDETADALRAAIAFQETHLEDVAAFLELLVSGAPVPDGTAVVGFRRAIPHLHTGALDALMGTGDINLIEGNVRAEIVTHRASFESMASQLVEYRVGGHALLPELFQALAVLQEPGQDTIFPPPPSVMRGSPRVIGLYRAHGELVRTELRLHQELLDLATALSQELAGTQD